MSASCRLCDQTRGDGEDAAGEPQAGRMIRRRLDRPSATVDWDEKGLGQSFNRRMLILNCRICILHEYDLSDEALETRSGAGSR